MAHTAEPADRGPDDRRPSPRGRRARAVLLGNGRPPEPELLARHLEGHPLLLCADGGANTALALGHRPDWVVGDFDSVAGEVLSRIPPERQIRVDAEDTGTDLEKALRHASSLGVAEAVLLGFTGGRVDHTLWNLGVVAAYGRRPAPRLRLWLLDDHCEVHPIGGALRFGADVGQKLSLATPCGPVEGITTRGLRWPLAGEALIPGERDGISNEVVDSPVEIRVERGDLLLCVQRDSQSGAIRILD